MPRLEECHPDFVADLRRFQAQQAGYPTRAIYLGDANKVSGRRSPRSSLHPLAQRTIETREGQIIRSVAGLVTSGVPPDEIRSLRSLRNLSTPSLLRSSCA